METLIEWGVAQRALKGQTVSGDLSVVEVFADGFLIAVIDGLGHGSPAAAAAQVAATILRANASASTMDLIHQCHQQLKQTRGVAMSLVSFNKHLSSLSALGVGNVELVLLRPTQNEKGSFESIPLRGGVVGYQLPPLKPSLSPIRPADTMIFATDGIRSEFVKSLNPADSTLNPQELADRLLATYDKGTDDSLVLVARYLGCQS